MKHLFLMLAILLSLNSCAHAGRCYAWNPGYDPVACDKDYYTDYHPMIRDPRDVQAYLAKHVDAATLKKWDKHVSDDTVVIQFNADTGEGSAR